MKMDDLKGIKRGRLRLGVITTTTYFAPELLGEFCKHYPGIEACGRKHTSQSGLQLQVARTPALAEPGLQSA